MKLNVIVNKKTRILAAVFFIHILAIIVFELIVFHCNIDVAKSKQHNDLNNPLKLLFSAVVFAPIIEEIIFRYGLVKSKYFYWGTIFSVVFILVTNFSDYFKGAIIILNVLSFGFFCFSDRKVVPQMVLIASVFVFTLIHISNYDSVALNGLPVYALVLQFFPQVLAGIILTGIRLYSRRFLSVIVYHGLYNLVFFGLALLQV